MTICRALKSIQLKTIYNPKSGNRLRPGFDLPDAFYFIGGPVFLLILLRVLVIFLNGFEEKRKEEENQAPVNTLIPNDPACSIPSFLRYSAITCSEH